MTADGQHYVDMFTIKRIQDKNISVYYDFNSHN